MNKNIKISELIPDDKNFNKGSEFGQGLIEKSFTQFGAGRSILIDKNNKIIAGNKSTENYGAVGGEDVIVVESDGSKLIAVKRTDIDLDTPQGREMALADNATAKANIVWAEEVIASELGVEVAESWGVDMGKELPEAEEDDFDATPPEEPITVLGDLYEIGEHRLLCGDSTDSDSVAKLMNGEKADMVFTDPPYGMAYESNAWDSKKNEVKQKRTDTQILNDENTNVGQDALNLIPLFLKNDRHFYIWCRWDCFNDFKEVCQSIGKIKSVIVWDKGGPGLGDLKGSYGDSEWSIFGMIGRRELKERQNGVWRVNRMKGLQMVHPTQKPLEICEIGINNSTNTNEIVLDLFLGSGSTMVASHQLKRKCYGMELDCKYCDVIVKRMITLDPTLKIKLNGIDVTKEWLNG